MTLIKQLWIAIALMMTLAFVSSFSVSTWRARDYFEEQLRLKNIDNANSLALMLSQVEKEPVMLELLISAQYDTGHYRRIALLDPEGAVVLEKGEPDGLAHGMPEWFRRLAPLQVAPGISQIQDGWRQFGTIVLESTSFYAQEALWLTTRNLFLWMLGIAVSCGILGSIILKFITQPLGSVVHQAEAIGERRFITSHEPRTLEFAKVVRAMNILSGRVRHTLEIEGGRLEELRRQSQMDGVTGLANRESFIDTLEMLLRHEDQSRRHGLLLMRVHNLAVTNRHLGYQQTNQLLMAVADVLRRTLRDYASSYTDGAAARLNGSDFALLLSDVTGLQDICSDLCRRFIALAGAWPGSPALLLPQAAGLFSTGESRAQVLMRIDSLLATAEQREETCMEIAIQEQSEALFHSAAAWRAALQEALDEENGVYTQNYPVLDMNNTLLHHEAMIRLTLKGRIQSAGAFLPWARRLGMLPQMDLAMVQRVLQDLRHSTTPIAVNLAIETLKNSVFRLQLVDLLKQHAGEAPRLWIELAEYSVINHLDLFLEFCAAVSPLKCKLGIEHAGAGFTNVNRLQEVGLSYLKVEAALVHDIGNNANNQNFLRGLSILGHSIGLLLIAEGVTSPSEITTLNELGLDGVTGPAVKLPEYTTGA